MSDEEIRSLELKITEILSHLRSELGGGGVTGSLPRRIDDLTRKVDRLTDYVIGTADRPGLVIRIDRLERSDATRRRLEWSGLLALLGLVVKSMWELIAG